MLLQKWSRIVGIVGLFFCLAASAETLPLMPWPQQVERPSAGGKKILRPPVTLAIRGDNLDGSRQRWLTRIARQAGWSQMPDAGHDAALTITIDIAQAVPPLPQPDSDERYQLDVTANGVVLKAMTRFGAMRGMETLLQLIQQDSENIFIPLIHISDWPRFAWRGLLLDSARQFIPVADLKRQIDGMAAARMNVFHWHLTDDQGWRFASDTFPRLQQQASDGFYYTHDDMKEIVRYAAERGVRVVPEIDMPGHSSALAVAMPELFSAPGPYAMQREWGIFSPVLDPANEAVYRFIDQLVAELATIFPDPYVHIGGDEVLPDQWLASAKTRQFMQASHLDGPLALQRYFSGRVANILARHQRRMVGWDDMAQPDLPSDAVIQSRRGQDALNGITAQGHPTIISSGFFLDQPQPAAWHYRNRLLPHSLAGRDQIKPGEQAQSWRFIISDLQDGLAEGSFTLIDGGRSWRGFIDFDGLPRLMVSDVSWISPVQVSFRVDGSMGELRPVVTLTQNELSGYVRAGNVRYPLSGHRLEQTPAGQQPVVLMAEQQARVLGAEAALWGENVSPLVLDTKLWPRVFMVAERLWSAAEVDNEDDMYQRLAAVDRWSVTSVGLRQYAQSQSEMMRLANRTDILPLQIFVQALEPVQYYTRQDLKSRKARYSQPKPLNCLVDVLPAESSQVRQLDKQVSALIDNRGDEQAAQAIRQQLILWRDNIPQVLPLIENNYPLSMLAPPARYVSDISKMGIALVNAIETNRTFGAREMEAMHQKLDEAAAYQNEVVVALVYPIEKLLHSFK